MVVTTNKNDKIIVGVTNRFCCLVKGRRAWMDCGNQQGHVFAHWNTLQKPEGGRKVLKVKIAPKIRF
ncbi:hypothetical protein SAMN04488057_12613 [Cyclobacterium lianum]|uniref:Uncharacterized protein n=1 Tax=Cyclobacterium lianum TaxID=388280 RepID=A0A1M7QU95_9BACT|nr:hypothetical protein SAMN04488057_12613 [Cyclobacterium lianum]